MIYKKAGFMEDFGKEYGYASPLLGLGLGTLAGVGINRFLLGNKSLKSNLIAGALGAAGGTGLGMYLGNNTHTAEKQEEVAEEAAKNKLEGYVDRFNKENPEAKNKSLNERQAMFIDWAKKKLPVDESESIVKDYSPRFIDSKASHIGEQIVVGAGGAIAGNHIGGLLFKAPQRSIRLKGAGGKKFSIKSSQGTLGGLLRGYGAGKPIFMLGGEEVKDLNTITGLTRADKKAIADLVHSSYSFVPGLSELGGMDTADRRLLKEWGTPVKVPKAPKSKPLYLNKIPWRYKGADGKLHLQPMRHIKESIERAKITARGQQALYAKQKGVLSKILSMNKLLSYAGGIGRGTREQYIVPAAKAGLDITKRTSGFAWDQFKRMGHTSRTTPLGAATALWLYNTYAPAFRESYSDKNNDIRSLLGN